MKVDSVLQIADTLTGLRSANKGTKCYEQKQYFDAVLGLFPWKC